MTDEELYARLRTLAALLRSAHRTCDEELDRALQAELPDWLGEEIAGVLRALETTAMDVGRFIREDQGKGPARAERLDPDES